MSTVKISTRIWKKIRADLQTEHKASVFMLRSRMKDVLGFTVREHNEWINGEHVLSICLDFYNERKYTMFLLKYSEFLNKEKK